MGLHQPRERVKFSQWYSIHSLDSRYLYTDFQVAPCIWSCPEFSDNYTPVNGMPHYPPTARNQGIFTGEAGPKVGHLIFTCTMT